jgi:hypothetical protein
VERGDVGGIEACGRSTHGAGSLGRGTMRPEDDHEDGGDAETSNRENVRALAPHYAFQL